MKDKIKGMIVGVIVGVAVAATSVFASTGAVQKMLNYNNIKITLNGQEIQPTDANGNYVEPFIIEGTTYLPVRGVANALGMNVNWDGNTNTVLLSTAMSNTGTVVYEKGGIKITYNGLKKDDFSTYFNFLIENNSPKAIMVQTRNASINGFMMTGIMSENIEPGKKSNAKFMYFNSALEENGISVIEELELSFYICDGETWDTIDESDAIKVTP